MLHLIFPPFLSWQSALNLVPFGIGFLVPTGPKTSQVAVLSQWMGCNSVLGPSGQVVSSLIPQTFVLLAEASWLKRV